jgi:hypothetical protein
LAKRKSARKYLDFCSLWLFSTRDTRRQKAWLIPLRIPLEGAVKKVAIALALVVASLSLAGCFVGKGKAPAPIVTKG